ncbi:MAG: PQQ-binding-like beta-propeller repeat protein [Pirellulales bacterium]
MNDGEWLQRLRSCDPAALTEAEWRELQRRLSESPEFCEALLSDPALARFAEQALARHEPTPVPVAPLPSGRRFPFRGIILLALAAALGIVAVWRLNFPGNSREQVASGPAANPAGKSPITDATSSSPADAGSVPRPPAPDAASPEGAPPTPVPADKQQTGGAGIAATPAPPPASETPVATPPATETAGGPPAPKPTVPVEPTPPPPPWQSVLDDPNPPPPYSATCWEGFDARYSLPTRETLQAWFETVPGHGLRWTDTRLPQGTCGSFEGVMRLRAPLGDDRVLRLALDNFPRLQIHLFAGQQGITLVWSQDDPRWAAYATRRAADSALPQHWQLVATDAGRARRTEFRGGGPWELRHHAGEVLLSRGDVVLVRAPLPAVPTEVLFQGRAMFYGLALARTSDTPPRELRWPESCELPAAEAAYTVPAAEAWTQRLPEGVTWARDSTGAWRLATAGVKARGWVATRLPASGLHEIVLQLSEASVGTGVFLAAPDQPPQQVLRVVHDRRSGQPALVWCGDDDRWEVPVPAPPDSVAPLAPEAPWLRFVVGCGLVRAWQSANGSDWVELPAMARMATRGLTHLGFHHVGAGKSASLVLRRLWIQPLAELTAAAEQTLASDTQALLAAKDLAAWEQAVRDSRPPQVPELDWWRTCAAVTLAAGSDAQLGPQIVDRWLDSLDPTWPLERRLAILGQAAVLLDVTDTPALAQRLVERYHRAGWAEFEARGAPPYSAVRRALQTASFHQRQNDVAFQSRAVRTELLQQLYDSRWTETLELVRQLRFFHQQGQTPLLDWADTVARRATPGRDAPDTAATLPPARRVQRGDARAREIPLRPRVRRDAPRGKDGWSHPLHEELGKETYNALAELDTLIESGAFDDAARLVTQLDPGQVQGLAPLDADDELLASLPTAVAWYSAQFPALREAIRARFDHLAPLRLRPALQTGEPAAVELVTLQFAGTAAAAEGQQWLGDRALARGALAQARAAYRRAQVGMPAAQRPALDARLRLVGAMLGEDVGTPPVQPVTLGQHTLAVSEFEGVVSEQRAKAQSQQRQLAERRPDVPGPLAPPPPQAVEPQVRAPLDGLLGERPQEEVTRSLDRLQVDWAGRQISWLIDGEVLLVNNRFHLAAYQVPTGQRLWQTAALEGKKALRSRDWSLVAMAPRVRQGRVYARVLAGDGPLLGCWEASSGQLVWLADQLSGVQVASDPWLVNDTLLAFTVTRTDGGETQLRLATLDASTGDLLTHVDVAQLRNSWWARHCCEVTLADDTLIAVLGGAVLACDLRGQVRWIRRQITLPADEESEWVTQSLEPPLVRGDRLYVAQPGVRVVDCLEIDTGRRVWRRFVPDVRRVAAIDGTSLIVVTDRGLEALAAADGSQLWRRSVKAVGDTLLAGGPQGIACTQFDLLEDGKQWRPQLVWLDATTGEPRVTVPLTAWTDPAPRCGPLIPYQNRLFAFWGKGPAEAKRELVELTSK